MLQVHSSIFEIELSDTMRRYLAELSLVPGAAFALPQRLPFNGPVQLKVGSLEPVIGFELAGALWVSCCSTC
jgi:Fe2+ transport system protein FeoA